LRQKAAETPVTEIPYRQGNEGTPRYQRLSVTAATCDDRYCTVIAASNSWVGCRETATTV